MVILWGRPVVTVFTARHGDGAAYGDIDAVIPCQAPPLAGDAVGENRQKEMMRVYCH